MFKRILVPVDFSASSLRALDDAVELARGWKAEIILVHAVENISFAGDGGIYGPVYDTTSLLRQFVRFGREQLSRLSAQLAKRRVRARTVLEIGTAHDVIVRAAKRLRADLIVQSTHGRSGLAHVFMGSVAEKVVRHAACPVLTVRGLKATSAVRRTLRTRHSVRPSLRPMIRGTARVRRASA